MHPVYEILPPIGWSPSTHPIDQPIAPPIGGSHPYLIPPPIGSTLVYQPLTPPMGALPAMMVLHQPVTPPIGATPVSLIASQPILPPIGDRFGIRQSANFGS